MTMRILVPNPMDNCHFQYVLPLDIKYASSRSDVEQHLIQNNLIGKMSKIKNSLSTKKNKDDSQIDSLLVPASSRCIYSFLFFICSLFSFLVAYQFHSFYLFNFKTTLTIFTMLNMINQQKNDNTNL